MAKYNLYFVFEPTKQSLTILDYESSARSKEDLVKEIIHYTTIQTFEVENA
jgi:hypothetical protein